LFVGVPLAYGVVKALSLFGVRRRFEGPPPGQGPHVADFDIVTLILGEHEAFRRAFTEIEQLDDAQEAGSRWRELADQLEVHAAGEEEVFYPALLKDVDGSEGETEHAVKDHNEIRETTRKVDDHEVGSDAWWEAFREAREATVEHLGEEENDVFPPFQSEVPEDKRTELGMAWLKFLERHAGAKGLDGEEKDPEQYVEEHSA
jgi:hemerythrin superfamily protein